MSEQAVTASNKQSLAYAKQVNNIYIGSGIAVLAVYSILAVQTSAWQIFVSNSVLATLIVLFFISRRLINNGRIIAGTQLSIYATITAVFINGVIMSGLGLAFAIGLVAIASQIGSLLLTNRQTTQAIVVSALAGLIMIALDSFDLSFRLSLSVISVVINVAAALMMLVLGYLVYRNFSNYSLRGKLTVAMLAVAAFSVIVIAVTMTLGAQNTVLDQLGQTLETNAESRSLAIGQLLAQQIVLLETATVYGEINGAVVAQNETYGDEDPLQTILNREALWQAGEGELAQAALNNPVNIELALFQQQFPAHVEMFVTDRHGAIVAAADRTETYYYGEAEWWTAVRSGNLYLGNVERVSENAVPSIVYAVPIFTTNNQFAGALFSRFQLDALRQILDASDLGETVNVEIILPNAQRLDILPSGEFVLAPAGETVQEALSALVIDDEILVSLPKEGQQVLFSRADLGSLISRPEVGNMNWRILLSVAESEALAATQTQRQLLVLVLSVATVLAAAVASFVGQRLAEPIVQLTAVAQDVREGNLKTRAVVTTSDEIGLLATTFNEMTDRLSQTLQTLESRVVERTRALEASAQVSRQLSTILNQDELVAEVVKKVQSAFNYYHVHIYLWNEDKSRLKMMGGTGEAGQRMLAQQHSIPPGQGLVGRAAETNLPVLVADVTREANWLPNELLPETKSEAAVPIAVGGDVLGVLDVQQNEVNGLDRQDIELLQSVANQIAIGLQNARLLVTMQQKTNREVTINQIRDKILNTTDVESALHVAVRELGQALHAQKTAVYLSPTAPSTNGRSDNPKDKSA